MVLGKIYGQRCTRCGAIRTKQQFEGLPTCNDCQVAIKAEREEKRRCPMCQTVMDKSIVLNVIVDKCSSCHGAWLDAGELDLLKQAIEQDGDSSNRFAKGVLLGMALG